MTKKPFHTALVDEIKYNCDVSDARYWGYFSICGLLLRYRDLFRSEQGLKPWVNIPRAEILDWIQRKESRWPELENREFKDLTFGDSKHDPFIFHELNRGLEGENRIYGAGYGIYMKPTFFLADLISRQERGELTVYRTKKEYARDLFTSAGMLQGKSIFVRLEPLETLLWEKASELGRKPGAALEYAFHSYGLLNRKIDDRFEEKIAEITDRYSEVLVDHEIAEFREAVPGWPEILVQTRDRKAEHYLRAIKDLIADTSEYGPFKKVIEARDRAALGLSIALREGFLKALYPEMREAFDDFMQTENWQTLDETRLQGYRKFSRERKEILELYGKNRQENFILKLNLRIHEMMHAGR